MKKIRLILVGPYPKPFGGIASLVVSLTKGLPHKQNIDDVSVVCFGTENRIEIIDGIKIYRINLKQNIWRLLSPLNFKIIFISLLELSSYKIGFNRKAKIIIKTILLNKIVSKHNSNTAHFFQSDNSIEILTCQKVWQNKISIILEIFGEIYTPPIDKFIKSQKKLFSRLLEIPQNLIASSEHCAQSFNILDINHNVEVVYIGVDINKFSNLEDIRSKKRKDLGIFGDTTVFLFLGRFNSEMGLDSLIEAIPKVIQKNKDVKFILAGASGPLNNLVNNFSQNYKDYIHVYNDVPFESLPSLYAASDVICAPSSDQRACMGVSIKEAMASSKPVIATKSGGIPEAIIHNENGYLIPHLKNGNIDIESISNSMLLLSSDSNLRKEMGANALERCKKYFDTKTTIEKTADIYFKSIK